MEKNYQFIKSKHKATKIEDYYYFKNFQIVKIGSMRQVLGKGAFAEVVLVKNKQDGKHFAMKIIEKKKVEKINIIKDEIDIHLSLTHPNIIKLYSFSETTDYFYLVMEYAEKGNVYNEIRVNNGIEEGLCREYFVQVIAAISYLHKLGYAHRDIKPENLLLEKSGNVKVCDFGGAVRIENGNQRTTFFGTYEYMAPEIIEGGNYDRSVDIWALGILLYEMLHGYSPFRVLERKENMREYYQIYENIVLTEELTVNDNLSDEVTHLIRNLLIKDKTKRITVTDVMNHPWINKEKFQNTELANEISFFHYNPVSQVKNNMGKSDITPNIVRQVSVISDIKEREDNNDTNIMDESIFDKVLDQVKKNNTKKKKSNNINSVKKPRKEESIKIHNTMNKLSSNAQVLHKHKERNEIESLGQEKLNQLKNNISQMDRILDNSIIRQESFRHKTKQIENDLNNEQVISVNKQHKKQMSSDFHLNAKTETRYQTNKSNNKEDILESTSSNDICNQNNILNKEKKIGNFKINLDFLNNETKLNPKKKQSNKHQSYNYNRNESSNNKYVMNPKEQNTVIYQNFEYDSVALDLLENIKKDQEEKETNKKNENGFFRFLSKLNPFYCGREDE